MAQPSLLMVALTTDPLIAQHDWLMAQIYGWCIIQKIIFQKTCKFFTPRWVSIGLCLWVAKVHLVRPTNNDLNRISIENASHTMQNRKHAIWTSILSPHSHQGRSMKTKATIDSGSKQGCAMSHGSKSLISLVVGWVSTTGVLWMKIKRLWEHKDEFFSIFVKFSSQDLKGHL